MDITIANYVDTAESVMKSFMKKPKKDKLTTTKIRNFLSLSQALYDQARLKTGPLANEEIADLQHLRVRIVYESGRDKDKIVSEFVKESKILDMLKNVGNNRDSLFLFCNYFEALVAYHRYFGGEDE